MGVETKDAPGMLEYLEQEKAEHVQVIERIVSKAESEFRGLTPEEKDEVTEHKDEAHKLNDRIKGLKENRALAESIAALAPGDTGDAATPAPTGARTIGEAFVRSDAFKALQARGTTGKFTMGPVQLPEFGAVSGVVTEGTGDNADMFLPQRIPGIQAPVEPPLGLTELFGTGTISRGNSVILVREKVSAVGPLPDNNAAVVAEGDPKPASNLEFETETATLDKVATVIKVSTEMLEDEDAMQTYLDGRLALFVRQKREDLFAAQLLSQAGGAADANDLTDGSNLFDAILAGAVSVRRNGGLDADAVAMTMLDWASLLVAKDGDDRYLSGGPFAAADGQRLWGRYRVAIVERLGDGNIVVGSFAAGGTVWRKRGGVTVDATNSNEDDFLNNLTAIRAEERATLFLTRPDAFCVVTLTS